MFCFEGLLGLLNIIMGITRTIHGTSYVLNLVTFVTLNQPLHVHEALVKDTFLLHDVELILSMPLLSHCYMHGNLFVINYPLVANSLLGEPIITCKNIFNSSSSQLFVILKIYMIFGCPFLQL